MQVRGERCYSWAIERRAGLNGRRQRHLELRSTCRMYMETTPTKVPSLRYTTYLGTVLAAPDPIISAREAAPGCTCQPNSQTFSLFNRYSYLPLPCSVLSCPASCLEPLLVPGRKKCLPACCSPATYSVLPDGEGRPHQKGHRASKSSSTSMSPTPPTSRPPKQRGPGTLPA
ncbi:hypothetical protein LZ32DRAFT_182724 [Colletotrichum eremochloae]|nr:hypothetical protein LZ32DRAFT_182724 [Colletotrichum eremochloae]